MVLEAQADIEVVGEAADGRWRSAKRCGCPDVVLMDVRMPGTDGIQATRVITRAVPGARVLILTTFDLDEYAFAGLRAGASGFLLKDAPPISLPRPSAASPAVMPSVAPRVTRRLLDTFAQRFCPTKTEAGRA